MIAVVMAPMMLFFAVEELSQSTDDAPMSLASLKVLPLENLAHKSCPLFRCRFTVDICILLVKFPLKKIQMIGVLMRPSEASFFELLGIIISEIDGLQPTGEPFLVMISGEKS